MIDAEAVSRRMARLRELACGLLLDARRLREGESVLADHELAAVAHGMEEAAEGMLRAKEALGKAAGRLGW